MTIKKITIIGNSVALRNRPHTKEKSLNYGQLIEQALNRDSDKTLYLVSNLAFGRATMTDLHKVYDSMINSYADLYIINIGVSDACTREIPLWFSNILNRKNKNIITNIFQLFYNIFIKRFRRQLVLLRGKRPWLNKRKFIAKYSKLIDDLQHNTSGKILCLSMNLANDRIEEIVPGTKQNYIEYNKEIEKLCAKFDIDYLNLDALEHSIHYPDGTHFSEEGNKVVAGRILSYINKQGL